MNTADFNELNEDLKIDRASIEKERVKLAIIFFKWSKLFVESQNNSNEAKAKLTYIQAFLSDDIRTNYDNYNLESRPTETAIRNMVVQNKDYIKARCNHATLQLRTEFLSLAVKAFEFKKSALEKL